MMYRPDVSAGDSSGDNPRQSEKTWRTFFRLRERIGRDGHIDDPRVRRRSRINTKFTFTRKPWGSK